MNNRADPRTREPLLNASDMFRPDAGNPVTSASYSYSRQQTVSPTTTTAPSSSVAVSDLPQSQIDAIIRTKRKAREPKACYPCHARKVKCDRNLPCDGCVKRDHADLCTYERPSKRRQSSTQPLGGQLGAESPREQLGATVTTPDVKPRRLEVADGDQLFPSEERSITIPRQSWENVCSKLKEMEETITALRSSLEQAENSGNPLGQTASRMSSDESQRADQEGIHTSKTYGEGTVHLGSRSVLAYILNKSGSLQAQALLEGGILPKLGLDNETATYPFVDLWSSDTSTFDVNAVCSALPSDEQIREYFTFYRDVAGTLYPVLVDVQEFEEKMETFLRNRKAAGGVLQTSEEGLTVQPFGMSLAFVGLLFAVLASGCQSSNLPGKERELTSQVYICCSYQCLRMTNFVSQPTLEAMKTLLIIGNVLSYNMNPGVSYVLLGMTIRMGLALGLHVESNRFSPVERYTRRHIWWSMAWQDSHFSLSYDRPSTVAVSQPDVCYRPESLPRQRDYFETMCRIISLTLEVVRGRMLSPHFHMSLKTMQAYKERVHEILRDAAPHLRDRSACTSPTEHLQRIALRVHSSYIMSELCRPSLKTTADKNDPLLPMIRQDCVDSLINTVESYIELHSFSTHGSRAWITMQRAISCAFLLAVIDEAKNEPKVPKLLHALEVILSERANDEGEIDPTDVTTATQQATAPGLTNAPLSVSDSLSGPQVASIPANVAIDTRTQWAKPLVKSLRALQKLNAAFATYTSQTAGGGSSVSSSGSTTTDPSYQTTYSATTYGVPATSYVRSASSGAPSVPSTTVAAPSISGTLPPPTPESSGSSSDWSFPTSVLDRAAEYIHPPLWG